MYGLVGLIREEIAYAILNHNASNSSTPGRLGNEQGALKASDSVINSGKKLVAQTFNVLMRWFFEVNGLTYTTLPKFTFLEVDEGGATPLEFAETDVRPDQKLVDEIGDMLTDPEQTAKSTCCRVS